VAKRKPSPKSKPKVRKPASRQKATADLIKLNSEMEKLKKRQAKLKGAAKGHVTRQINSKKKQIRAAKGRLYRARNRGKAAFDRAEKLRKENKKAARGKSSTKGKKTSKTAKLAKTKKTTKTRSKSQRKK